MSNLEKRKPLSAEHARLEDSSPNTPGNWKAIGPYVSERAWVPCVKTTVPISKPGNTSHTNTRARAPIGRARTVLPAFAIERSACVSAPAFWNGRDPFPKECILGLSGPEGNHGEDAT
jgi:hypothetical protein